MCFSWLVAFGLFQWANKVDDFERTFARALKKISFIGKSTEKNQFKKFLTLDPLMKTSQFFQFFCDFIFFETNSTRTASKLSMNVVPGEMLTLSNGTGVPLVFSIACNLLVNPNNPMKKKTKGIYMINKCTIPSFTLRGPFCTWCNAIDWQEQHFRRNNPVQSFDVA